MMLGRNYEQNIDTQIRKSMGQYYTPKFIIEHILKNTIGNINVVENPFVSIIDISCGAGYFLEEAYEILKNKFLADMDKIREMYSEEIYMVEEEEIKGEKYWQNKNIHYHILKNCIYGADKDEEAANLTKICLWSKGESSWKIEPNIVVCDSLVRWEQMKEEGLADFWKKKHDFSIGNPPYIGHKQLDMEYKEWLLQEYKEVFRDKSDISFCFFQRILENLKPKGMAGIISSRYFMENPTGKVLRKYLKENTNIIEIVDFYGGEIFKGIGVATAIYLFRNEKITTNSIKVHKLIDDNYKHDGKRDLENIINSDLFESFYIEQDNLQENRWIFLSEKKMKIYKKIEEKCKLSLRDIVISFQGIITGCDRAFVLNDIEVMENDIEIGLLKKWIKNSNVNKYDITGSELYLIYSNLIDDESKYPNSIRYIERYRERLENRRECKNGKIKWFNLQWGRSMENFQQPKIVFPYKASNNRFAIDYDGTYCSADVYSIIIKDEFKEKISLEYLVGLLNSDVYDFYFKLFAKKLGKGIYDYYPNSVLDMKIISEDIVEYISSNAKEIMKSNSKDAKENIDRAICEYLGL